MLLYFILALSIQAAAAPLAKEILDSVRMLESRQQIDLQGQLRENEIVIPFRLTQTGPLIRYSFADPEEVLELRLGENSSNFSTGRTRACLATKPCGRGVAGNCNCMRRHANRNTRMSFCG
jgi:hypothetical protein